jgi:UrcA family protein
MNARRILHRAGPAILAAGLCLTAAALAAEPLPTITIGAGVVTREVISRSASGVPMEKVTLTHRVSYADLDLATEAGAAALRKRVQETARTACKQLDELYPLEAKNRWECTKAATADASAQVESAIAAARREASAR